MPDGDQALYRVPYNTAGFHLLASYSVCCVTFGGGKHTEQGIRPSYFLFGCPVSIMM